MESNAFSPLAVQQLPTPGRLLASACCPDKDLVVLISRVGFKDRLSLWKVQGSRKWEVSVSEENRNDEIAGLAWSPDGQSVALAHNPPLVTLHSIQDGQQESLMTITAPTSSTPQRSASITGMWWFKDEKTNSNAPTLDIFKRNNTITGSAHSILQTLPFLDHLQGDTQKLTATDMFIFQGSQAPLIPKSALPEVIKSWPTLPPDPHTRVIKPVSQDRHPPGNLDRAADDIDNDNLNSILAVADDLGFVHYFLDGSYPLGAIRLGGPTKVFTSSLFRDPKLPTFYVHPQTSVNGVVVATDIQPTIITLPLLDKRHTRDMAKLSSTARELVWYTTRVVKEMRNVWFGGELHSGARELGPKWIRALESKQKEQFGQEDPNPILDLTRLLVTGLASDSVQDFLGSGDQISERGIHKWETTVTEALVSLRDFAENRVAPACQRLHLVLEEVQGWSLLPQYAVFELSADEIGSCVELAGRAIVISAWLAAVARRELSRFKEFILWLKYETAIANPTSESHATPRHDLLEVNGYLMSGLVVSSIDKWFIGPAPRFSSRDICTLGDKRNLSAVLDRAGALANDPVQLGQQSSSKQGDLNHLDRNLEALVQELTTRCHRLFSRASGAATRSAVVTYCPGSVATHVKPSSSQISQNLVVRERIIRGADEAGNHLQYLAMRSPLTDRTLLCLVHTPYGQPESSTISVAIVQCCLPEGRENYGQKAEIVDADFFDDDCVVVVVRAEDGSGPTFIAMVNYNDLRFEGRHVGVSTREELMLEVMQQWKEGHLQPVRIPLKRRRTLVGCGKGEVNIALNGRVGRRIACVLNETGSALETFDLEGDGEDDEDPEVEVSGSQEL